MKHLFLVFPAENVRVQRNIFFSGKCSRWVLIMGQPEIEVVNQMFRTIPFEKRQKTWAVI